VPKKSQKKAKQIKKARQDPKKPDLTLKTKKTKKNANRKFKMPEDFQKQKIPQIWLRKMPSGHAALLFSAAPRL
jgi:hypothetical protein